MANREEIQQSLRRQIANKELGVYEFRQGRAHKVDAFLYIDRELACILHNPQTYVHDIVIPIGLTTAGATNIFSKPYTMDLIMDIIEGHIGNSHTFDEKAAHAIEKLTEVLK